MKKQKQTPAARQYNAHLIRMAAHNKQTKAGFFSMTTTAKHLKKLFNL